MLHGYGLGEQGGAGDHHEVQPLDVLPELGLQGPEGEGPLPCVH
jgi:hypothetical protein